MTASNARLLVLGMGAVLGASALVGKGPVIRALGGQPTSGGGDATRYRRLWSVGIVVLVLSLVADLAPDLVGPFALLVLAGWYISGSRTNATATVTAPAAQTSPSAFQGTYS